MPTNGRGRRSRVLVIILSTIFLVVALCSLVAYGKVIPSYSKGSSAAGGPAAGTSSSTAALVVEGQEGAPSAVRASALPPSSAANEKGATSSRQRLVEWWQNHPSAPLGISCDPTSQLRTDANDATATSMGLPIPPPLFRARSPAHVHVSHANGEDFRVEVAMVVPFVPFQLPKIVHLLSKFWSNHPPCLPDTPKQPADLVFFTESEASHDVKETIMHHFRELGQVNNATNCFHNANEPTFLSLTNVDPELSHLEGAASAFFSLFEVLETKYRTFLLAEPDVVPVQGGFVPALVRQSKTLGCEDDSLWQVGAPPLVADVEAGMLRERVDYHMNGNAMYALGCVGFEDYKCRAQTFYVPKDECSKVAGCGTHEAYEGGYDHSLYRFRMHPENYEYSRLIMNRFAYSNFVQNRGEAIYDPKEVARDSKSTYFVHSKGVYTHPSATILKEAVVGTLRRDICVDDDSLQAKRELDGIFHKLKEGKYEKVHAIKHLCQASKNGVFGDVRAIASVCEDAERSNSKRLSASENNTDAGGGGDDSIVICEDGWDSIIPTKN